MFTHRLYTLKDKPSRVNKETEILSRYENLLKSIDFANKITYYEYNSSGYLISAIIKM